MRQRLVLLLVLSVVSLQARRCFAEGDGIPDVAYLAHLSDVIVTGTASLQSSSAQTASIHIQIDRVIKGTIAGTDLSVAVAITRPECAIPPNPAPVHALWFLRRLTDGTFAFSITPKAQACHPFSSDYEIPSGPLPARWAYANSLQPKDKLAYELAAAFDSGNGHAPSVFGLNPLILNSAEESTAKDINSKLKLSTAQPVQALGQLGSISEGDHNELENLKTSDSLALKKISTSFMKGGQQVFATASSGGTTYEHLVERSMESITTGDSTTVQALTDILDGPLTPSSLRFSAARALRNLHTPKAVMALAPYLSGQDYALRAEAVGCLALFANSVPSINPSSIGGGIDLNQAGPFKTQDTMAHFTLGTAAIAKNPDFYIGYWEQWWSANASAVTSQAGS